MTDRKLTAKQQRSLALMADDLETGMVCSHTAKPHQGLMPLRWKAFHVRAL